MQKSCRQCQSQFEITAEDLKFYEKVSPVFAGKKYLVPPPTLCPDCRQQRRLVFRNERKLYHRKCSSCEKEIISVFSTDKKGAIFCSNCWWSDKWDGLDYGIKIDFSKSFLSQYQELLNKVPRIALLNNKAENSDFCNYSDVNKNCYLILGNNNENTYYGYFITHNNNCVDILWTIESQNCYETSYCEKCYNLAYSTNCFQCSDSYFLRDCHNCKNCIGCTNLRNKEYYVFNEPVTKEAYEKILNSFKGKRFETQKIMAQFLEISKSTPHIYINSKNSENISGNNIYNSKNVNNSYDIFNSQDCKFCYDGIRSKDSYDNLSIDSIELCYETQSSIGYHYLFASGCRTSSDIFYSDFCHNSKNLFGCIGLKNKEYCILNQQYTKEEYEALIPQIIEHMGKEWGEFFPMQLSPFGYNETSANEYFPLTKEKALQQKLNWKADDKINHYQGAKMDVPNNIQDIDFDITKNILTCEACEKNFKMITQEVDFYKKTFLPAPNLCPDCRHKNRMQNRNPRHLWPRTCSKCSTPIQTSYSPNRPEIVYCESCYLKEIY